MKDYRIEIRPFPLLNILSVKCCKKVNEHGTLFFAGHIGAENEEYCLAIAMQANLQADVVLTDEDGNNEFFFRGIVSELQIQTENDVRTLSGTIKTGSYLMDQTKHVRSFQSDNITYDKILNTLGMSYQNTSFIMTAGSGECIQGLILQYFETDWEFAKRLATHFHTVLVPDDKMGGVRFNFGIPDMGCTIDIQTKYYSVKSDINRFLWGHNNGLDALTEMDSVFYTIESREVYRIGTQITLNGKSLFVYSIDTELVGKELLHLYYLLPKSGFQVPQNYNDNSIGISLSATVAEVAKDDVKIKIAGDENENSGTRWFPYSTIYSTQDGTGWYCMPEIGDVVRLYVPCADETTAYAISSTHLQSRDENERINPDYKSIMNKQKKEILFMPGALVMTNNKGMSITLSDKEGISISSNKAIIINSQTSINISSSSDTLRITAPKAVTLRQGTTQLQLKNNLTFSGGQVRIE